MIKRTISIEKASRLSIKDSQLFIEQDGNLAGRAPVEDIGVLIIDHPAVLYTHACLVRLLENNAAVVICGANHHPNGLLLPLDANSVQAERFRHQAEAPSALKNRLWKQTVQTKISNQAGVLKEAGGESKRLEYLARVVKSGDKENLEAQAARYYWPRLFGRDFRRDRFGKPPNNLLNYGYMALRAAVARSLVCSGLLPTFPLHHKNRYNAFGPACAVHADRLADDIMEPYRPFIDRKALDVQKNCGDPSPLTRETKKALLETLVCDVRFKRKKRPLLVGLSLTTASLCRCFLKEQKEIDYPRI